MSRGKDAFCECQNAYTGLRCEHRDDCYSMPCFNDALCDSDPKGGFTCMCMAGFTGKLCDVQIRTRPSTTASTTPRSTTAKTSATTSQTTKRLVYYSYLKITPTLEDLSLNKCWFETKKKGKKLKKRALQIQHRNRAENQS